MNSIIRADDAVTFGYLACVTLLVLVFNQRVENAWVYPLLHIVWGIAILVLIQKTGQKPNSPWLLARNWYHVLNIPIAFRELHYLVHPIHPRDLDPLWIKADFILFGGVNPTVWMERWMHPWLTEYLQIIYSSFYFLPLILGVLLWRHRDYQAFRNVMTGIVTAFYLSYLGYFAFPTLGPRFELAHLQQQGLQGIWLVPWLRSFLDRFELIQRDAFPSGHTAVSLLVLYYVQRYRPRLFIPCLVVVSSLVFSTVYLRYHYVVDVFAGVILAIISEGLARSLEKRLGGYTPKNLRYRLAESE